MCQTCGCALPGAEADLQTVSVMAGLLDANDRAAAHNRDHLDAHGVVALNLMSAPGSGKTSLLEATIEALGDRYRIAVIEGDLETENDAQRIRAHGVPAVQITTGNACHLDAAMVHGALHELALDALDLLFIENVGNLVCPASFDLGQHYNVTLLSVPEGDDKPAKYPVMFRAADVVLLSKADLLPLLDDFKPQRARAALANLATGAEMLAVDAKHGELAAWLDWLHAAVAAQRSRRAQARTRRPSIERDAALQHAPTHG